MRAIAGLARYFWRFFVGDAFQLVGLGAAVLIAALLAHSLRAWDGLLLFALVMAVIWLDVWRRTADLARGR